MEDKIKKKKPFVYLIYFSAEEGVEHIMSFVISSPIVTSNLLEAYECIKLVFVKLKEAQQTNTKIFSLMWRNTVPAYRTFGRILKLKDRFSFPINSVNEKDEHKLLVRVTILKRQITTWQHQK